MTIAALALLTLGLATAASLFSTRLALAYLRSQQLLDIPNERSSHAKPTPRGGGIGVVPILLAGWGLLIGFGFAPSSLIPVIAAAAGLAALSFFDDRRGLSARLRLAVQVLALAVVVPVLTWPDAAALAPLPLNAVMAAVFVGGVWFVNLYNFMDGIDGICGVETGVIGGGIAVLAMLRPELSGLLLPALVFAGCGLGFLWWNWHPARLFMGDVGSVPLGLAGFWLLCELALAGAWTAALLLPLYYLSDATSTLLRRLVRGEKVWQAHRSHAYQLAVQRGRSHSSVSFAVGLCGVALVGLACLTETAATGALDPLRLAALASGGGVVLVLMAWMRRGAPREAR